MTTEERDEAVTKLKALYGISRRTGAALVWHGGVAKLEDIGPLYKEPKALLLTKGIGRAGMGEILCAMAKHDMIRFKDDGRMPSSFGLHV